MNRKFLPLLALILLLSIAAALYELSLPRVTLTVYSQGDCIDPRTLRSFTASTGIRVELHDIDRHSGGEFSPTGCDLLLADQDLLACMKEQSLLLPIDSDRFTRWAQFAPACLNGTSTYGDTYAVPCLWTTMGLLYDPTQTGTRVTDWTDLFHPVYEGRVAMTDRYQTAYTLSLVGGTDDSVCADDRLRAQSETVVGYYVEDDLAEAFRTGTVILAPCSARTAIDLMSEMTELTFIIPPDESIRTTLSYAIPARSRQQSAVYQLLNYLCTPSVLARNALYSGWSTPSASAFALLDPRWQRNPVAYPTGSSLLPDPLPQKAKPALTFRDRLYWQPEGGGPRFADTQNRTTALPE